MSLPNDTTIVPLSRGLVAIIDGADADRVLAHKWSAGWTGTRWYARRSIGTNGDYHHLYLHRFILDAPPGVRVDHENGDGLDCRRENLRFATVTQNAGNCGPRARSRSGYRGVGWSAKEGKWIAQIQFQGNKIRIGCFTDSVDAAREYNMWARILFGEFAHINVIE